MQDVLISNLVFNFIANYEFVYRYLEKLKIKSKKKKLFFFDDVFQIKLFKIHKAFFYFQDMSHHVIRIDKQKVIVQKSTAFS